jgi:hypothetical protein
MEKFGKTILFIRRENSPTDLIPDVRGYSHTFLDEYTTWGLDLQALNRINKVSIQEIYKKTQEK